MKMLYAIRHAKSSWDDLSLDDLDRPLNERGERDAPRMGKRLKERHVVPDLMITSPAKRALSTCKKIAKILDYPKEAIKVEPKLYHASEDQFLQIVHSINNKQDTVLLFGHNPGLTDFVNKLTEGSIQNIPTCGVAACSFKTESWNEVGWKKATLEFFDFPKNKD